MRYIVTVDGEQHQVLIERLKQENEIAITLGEQRFEASVVSVGANAFSVLVDGRCFDFLITRSGRELSVASRSGSWRVNFYGAREKQRSVAAGAAEGRVELRAMMPGRVVEVKVKVGDEVEAEQGVVVIEAMKMENELKTPKTGKVVEVRVREGQTVEKGDLLVVIE